MKGRMGILAASAAIYMLSISLPVIVVEQITGLWDAFGRAMEEYMALFANLTYEALMAWAEAWSDKLQFSFASFIFVLLVPGPLTLGLSAIWLQTLRGKEASPDMVFSGFGAFLRVVLMDTARRLFMLLWAILLVVPGIIAYYRYSLAFFLLADNPDMGPLKALSLSKHYMRQNKGARFFLDLSLIGWLAVSAVAYYLLGDLAIAAILQSGSDISFFMQQLVSGILAAIVFSPLCAYRGVASAEFYHRVICRDPKSFPELPAPG